jgi:hypothetical protein
MTMLTVSPEDGGITSPSPCPFAARVITEQASSEAQPPTAGQQRTGRPAQVTAHSGDQQRASIFPAKVKPLKPVDAVLDIDKPLHFISFNSSHLSLSYT